MRRAVQPTDGGYERRANDVAQRVVAGQAPPVASRGGATTIRRDLAELPDMRTTDLSGGSGEVDSDHEKSIGAMEGTKEGLSAFGEFDSSNSYRTDLAKSHGQKEDDATGTWGDKSGQNGISYTANALSTFDLALDISRTVKIFMDSSTSGAEKAGAVLGTIATGAKTGAGMSGIAKTAQDAQEGSTTDVANNIMGEIAGILTVLSSGYQLVKTIVELISEAGDLTDKEKTAKSFEAIKSALDTAKGVIETINKFMGHLGTVGTGLVTAVPAIGIAISCVDMIMNGVNMGFAYVSWAEMREDKRVFKEQATDKLAGKTFWGGNKSYKSIAKTNIAEGDKALADKDAAAAALAQARQARNDNRKEVDDAKAEVTRLEGELKATKDKRKKTRLERELKKAKAALATAEGKTDGLRSARADARTESRKKDAEYSALEARYENSKEYMVSKNLQDIAAKRIRRGALNIGLTLPSIAGDIAILSGAGAAVGGGLKAASGGGKLLAVGVRMGKQAYHNARGDSKSEENKLKMYDATIKGIIGHVVQANSAVAPADVPLKKKALREVSASGMALSTMQRLKGDGPALYSAWITALKQR